jgi:hypothetical protein
MKTDTEKLNALRMEQANKYFADVDARLADFLAAYDHLELALILRGGDTCDCEESDVWIDARLLRHREARE